MSYKMPVTKDYRLMSHYGMKVELGYVSPEGVEAVVDPAVDALIAEALRPFGAWAMNRDPMAAIQFAIAEAESRARREERDRIIDILRPEHPDAIATIRTRGEA